MRRIKYSTEEERKAARKAYYRKWWEQHKKEISAKNVDYRAEYRASHKAEKSAYMAEYYKKNKERRAEYMALYKSTPIGRAHNLVRNYRRLDRDKNRGECTITPQWVVENIFSGQCCVYCGESDWHLLGCDRKDNALPHTPENCVPCCRSCNCKKHTKSYNEFIGV